MQKIKVGEVQLDCWLFSQTPTPPLDNLRAQIDAAEAKLKEQGAIFFQIEHEDRNWSDYQHVYIDGYRYETPKETEEREKKEEAQRVEQIKRFEEQLKRLKKGK